MLRAGGRRVVQHAVRRQRHEHVGHVRHPRERARRPRSTRRAFLEALIAGCIAHDGDARARRRGRDAPAPHHRARRANDVGEAQRVAKSLVNSPLVKTMVYGADPNVGRCSWRSASASTARSTASDRRVDQRPSRCVARRPAASTSTTRVVRTTLLGSEVVDLEVSLGVGDGAGDARTAATSRRATSTRTRRTTRAERRPAAPAVSSVWRIDLRPLRDAANVAIGVSALAHRNDDVRNGHGPRARPPRGWLGAALVYPHLGVGLRSRTLGETRPASPTRRATR